MTSKTGIYKITNIQTGKIYIGSALDVDRRFYHHKNDLKCRKHRNRYLQCAWDKYGEESFSFELLDLCDKDERFRLEAEYIIKSKSNDRRFGYNTAYPVRQNIPSPEMSKVAKKSWSEPTAGHNRRQGIRAKWQDEEFRVRKEKDFVKGRAIALARWNDPIFRAKQSEIRSSKWDDPEWRKAREIDLKLKTLKAHMPKAKAKRKASLIAMWADPEFKAKHIEGMRQRALAMTKARMAKRSSNEIV